MLSAMVFSLWPNRKIVPTKLDGALRCSIFGHNPESNKEWHFGVIALYFIKFGLKATLIFIIRHLFIFQSVTMKLLPHNFWYNIVLIILYYYKIRGMTILVSKHGYGLYILQLDDKAFIRLEHVSKTVCNMKMSLLHFLGTLLI
ncbi:hypothetical protein IEQ34_015858 [Dendrobium chrysotoxum]|uniref:Uncharacterized protein n=1 Tax=Dendrobium chrysotoxum TaxID=161865 RepID=A0AAV7GI99_DENCH|nr:hypothetical protein IEQ34_015858 [Dendrobium chrysotoxum]